MLEQETIEILKSKIDNFILENKECLFSYNPEAWANTIRKIILSSSISKQNITQKVLTEVVEYAMSKTNTLECQQKVSHKHKVDEKDSQDINSFERERALSVVKKFAVKHSVKREFPKTPQRWLNYIKTEIYPFEFNFPEYQLGTIANDACKQQNEEISKLSSTTKSKNNDLELSKTKNENPGIFIKNENNVIKSQTTLLNKVDETNLKKLFIKGTLNCSCGKSLCYLRHLKYYNMNHEKFNGRFLIVPSTQITENIVCPEIQKNKNHKKIECRCKNILGCLISENESIYCLFINKRIVFSIDNQKFFWKMFELESLNSKDVILAMQKLYIKFYREKHPEENSLLQESVSKSEEHGVNENNFEANFSTDLTSDVTYKIKDEKMDLKNKNISSNNNKNDNDNTSISQKAKLFIDNEAINSCKKIRLDEHIQEQETSIPNLNKENTNKLTSSLSSKTQRSNLRYGSQVDFRSSPSSVANGHQVPCYIIQMCYDELGLKIELFFEGYPRVFEQTLISSDRLAPYLSHRHEYRMPEELDEKLLPMTSYSLMNLSVEEVKAAKNLTEISQKIVSANTNDFEIIQSHKSSLSKYNNFDNISSKQIRFNELAFNQNNFYSPTDQYTQMNRFRGSIPDQFRGSKSQGTPTEAFTSNLLDHELESYLNMKQSLYVYGLILAPKDLGFSSYVSSFQYKQNEILNSFGFILENNIDVLPEMDAFLRTKDVTKEQISYDAVVNINRLGIHEFTFDQIDRIKKCHCFLYKPLCRGRLHKYMEMDINLPMFLIVPLKNDGKEIDWSVINRVYNAQKRGRTQSLLSYIESLRNSDTNNNENMDPDFIPPEQCVVVTIYDKQEQHQYSFDKIRTDLDPSYQCCHDKARPNQSQADFLSSEYNFNLSYIKQPLVDVYKFHPRAQSVLSPPVVERTHIPKIEQLVPEMCRIYPIPCYISSQFCDIVSIMQGLQNSLSVQKLQLILPVKPSLQIVQEALTFSQVSMYKNYERLEFLGDGILKFLASDYLFDNKKSAGEGILSVDRADIIKNDTLTILCKNKNLSEYALITKFQRKDYLPPCFIQGIEMKSRLNNCKFSEKQYADLIESLIGAAFLTEGPLGGFNASLEILKFFGSKVRRVEKIKEKAGNDLKKSSNFNDFNCVEKTNFDYQLEFYSDSIGEVKGKFPDNYLQKIKHFETTIGYTFKNKKLAVYALSQGSMIKARVDQAQRLEFLGDSVLDVLVTRKLYFSMQNAQPGDLTFARTSIVRNDALALFCHRAKFEEMLIEPSTSAITSIEKFYDQLELPENRERWRCNILPYISSFEQEENKKFFKKLKKNFNEQLDKIVEYNFPKILGDIFESVIGAVYLDSNRSFMQVQKSFSSFIDFPVVSEALAIDCEFIGIGREGHFHQLARVSVVDYDFNLVLDKYIKPQEEVVDWRTELSGVRPKDVENGHNFIDIQEEIAKLIEGKLVIGHNIESDLKVLCIDHPKYLLRDTAKFHKLCPAGPLSLKILCKKFLNIEMQVGEHCSVEDARETMRLYKEFMVKDLRDIDDFSELVSFDSH